MYRLDRNLHEQLMRDAMTAYPCEAIGLLFANDSCILVAATELANNHPRPRTGAAIRRSDMITAIEAARPLTFAGVYHSHPDAPPLLSRADRAQLQEFGLLWIISVGRGGVRGVGAYAYCDIHGAHPAPIRLT